MEVCFKTTRSCGPSNRFLYSECGQGVDLRIDSSYSQTLHEGVALTEIGRLSSTRSTLSAYTQPRLLSRDDVKLVLMVATIQKCNSPQSNKRCCELQYGGKLPL